MGPSAARGEVGVLDSDPFTNAQDVAESYSVGQAAIKGDTIVVSVVINFGASYRPVDRTGRLRVAVLRTQRGWRIADFLYSDGRSLAAGLRASPS
jgi:hypothetical protein